LAQELGIGVVLNFTAAMIVVDFDDIVVKLFVTLKTRAIFNDFLLFKAGKKILKNAEICKVRCNSGALMKWLAFVISFGALTYTVAVDMNLLSKYSLIPAVEFGFDIAHSTLENSTFE